MNPFQEIKNRMEANAEQKHEEQRQRIERLAQLEAAQNRKGFHIPNPVQSMNNKKEIKRLKKEIAAFEASKKNTKVIAGYSVFLAILLGFCGIMAVTENNAPPSEQETIPSVSVQEFTEHTLPDITENANSSLIETLPTETIEAPTEDPSMVTPTETQQETVPLTTQKFRITWSAQLVDSNHVGSNWSTSFEVDDEAFSSGSVITVTSDAQFTICLAIQENDSKPDREYYFERIAYSEELCANGYTVSDTVYVRENGGRYSGNCAEWNIKITLTPIN